MSRRGSVAAHSALRPLPLAPHKNFAVTQLALLLALSLVGVALSFGLGRLEVRRGSLSVTVKRVEGAVERASLTLLRSSGLRALGLLALPAVALVGFALLGGSKGAISGAGRAAFLALALVAGSVVPRKEVEIKPQVSGVVAEMFVQPGDGVKSGDLIAKIRIIPDMVILSEAENRVNQARLRLENARLDQERNDRLLAEGVVSRSDHQQVTLVWEQAREVNPWIVRYWTELALCQARLNRWAECAKTCEQTLERFPDGQGARQLLIECRLVEGRTDEAEQEYKRMMELNPPKAESIRQWWENHPLRKGGR